MTVEKWGPINTSVFSIRIPNHTIAQKGNVMEGYLIYHPRRCLSIFGSIKVYHDSPRGNQDPYIWNEHFLHTYCHITQIQPVINDINFWISGNTFPNFSHLYCDLIFVIQDKFIWKERNCIDCNDPIVDSIEAFIDHDQWAERGEHCYKKRQRFTLKADPDRSFQPQNANKELIDIIPFLVEAGYSLERLRREL
jgi:hypothetical protein